MNIREVTASDTQELLTLAIKIFRDTFTLDNTPEAMECYIAQDYTFDKLLAEYHEPASKSYFICDNSGKAVGYMRLRQNKEVDDRLGNNHIEIHRFYIDEAYHGRKVADQLMQRAVEIAKEKKHDWIWLGVWEFNPRAQRFYQKQGFEKFDDHDFYMGDERQTDWLMKKDLRH